jgi:ferredoxin
MLQLFYFSGTGNARRVATWVADAWRQRGREAAVVELAHTAPGSIQLGPEDELGLASPTHGFNLPPVTLAFLFALPRATRRNRALIFNTRAGLRLLGLHLPGLSGVAQLLAALVLTLKGYRVVAMRPVDLPSNWISLHPGLAPDAVRDLHRRCEAITRRSAGRLLDGRRDLRALWDLPQDLLLAPVALGYFLVGRYVLAKSFVASAGCDGCEACVRQCPVQAITLRGGRPFWSFRCESCMRCMNHCPRRAIQTAHGFVIGLALLVDLAVATLVLPPLVAAFPGLDGPSPLAWLALIVLESALLVGALLLAYRLLHRGLRHRAVERLVTLTSLTHFAWWRRYRAPRLFTRGTAPTPGAAQRPRPVTGDSRRRPGPGEGRRNGSTR